MDVHRERKWLGKDSVEPYRGFVVTVWAFRFQVTGRGSGVVATQGSGRHRAQGTHGDSHTCKISKQVAIEL